jgi:hypothetical protein
MGCDRVTNGYLLGYGWKHRIRAFVPERGNVEMAKLPAWNGCAGVIMMAHGGLPARP